LATTAAGAAATAGAAAAAGAVATAGSSAPAVGDVVASSPAARVEHPVVAAATPADR
jgi:hypothetical protein